MPSATAHTRYLCWFSCGGRAGLARRVAGQRRRLVEAHVMKIPPFYAGPAVTRRDYLTEHSLKGEQLK